MRFHECLLEVPKFEKGDGMKRTGIILVVLVAGLISLWLYWFPTYSLHQKMTVEVEAPRPPWPLRSAAAPRASAARDPRR
jgi:hypothetical protein